MLDLVQEFKDRRNKEQKKKKRRIFAIVGAIVAIAAAVAGWLFYKKQVDEANEVSPTEPPAKQTPIADGGEE
jgi:flagellar basal body-associated protein FliL